MMVQYDVKRVTKGAENFMVSFDFAKTPITQVADYIIIAASNNKASDIHFDPRDEGMMVRFRIDGDCQDYTFIPKAYERNLTTRLKLLANMNITETRLPQDGAIKGNFGDIYLDMRVACLPTNQGEKIVIRILDYSRSLQGIDSLGFHPKNLEKIHHMMGVPNGIILVTGATGSGKSTTTYSMLSALNRPEINVITVEDPVEMNIEGINQVQVNAEIGMTFAAALRSILREDPNVILIGEIRDSETAQIAVRASITGHLVMSTLHTNNALATVERLLDMDVERYLLSTALTGIISQRLAKALCPDCRIQREPTKYEKKVFKKFLHQDVTMVWDANPQGCDNCRKGYKGRIAVHEVLLLDDKIRNALNDEKMSKDDFAKMIYSGSTISMLQDALIKSLEGQTSFEEVYKTIEIENEDEDNYAEELEGITINQTATEEQVEEKTAEDDMSEQAHEDTNITEKYEIPGVTTEQAAQPTTAPAEEQPSEAAEPQQEETQTVETTSEETNVEEQAESQQQEESVVEEQQVEQSTAQPQQQEVEQLHEEEQVDEEEENVEDYFSVQTTDTPPVETQQEEISEESEDDDDSEVENYLEVQTQTTEVEQEQPEPIQSLDNEAEPQQEEPTYELPNLDNAAPQEEVQTLDSTPVEDLTPHYETLTETSPVQSLDTTPVDLTDKYVSLQEEANEKTVQTLDTTPVEELTPHYETLTNDEPQALDTTPVETHQEENNINYEVTMPEENDNEIEEQPEEQQKYVITSETAEQQQESSNEDSIAPIVDGNEEDEEDEETETQQYIVTAEHVTKESLDNSNDDNSIAPIVDSNEEDEDDEEEIVPQYQKATTFFDEDAVDPTIEIKQDEEKFKLDKLDMSGEITFVPEKLDGEENNDSPIPQLNMESTLPQDEQQEETQPEESTNENNFGYTVVMPDETALEVPNFSDVEAPHLDVDISSIASDEFNHLDSEVELPTFTQEDSNEESKEENETVQENEENTETSEEQEAVEEEQTQEEIKTALEETPQIDMSQLEPTIHNIQTLSALPHVTEQETSIEHTGSSLLSDPGIRIAEDGSINTSAEINADPILPNYEDE